MKALGDLFDFWLGPFGGHFLPGVLLPFAISIVAAIRHWGEVRKLAMPIMWCTLANVPYVVWQTATGWDGGLHLFAAFAFVVLGMWLRKQATIRPLVAYACTWFSLVGIDLAGGYLQLVVDNRVPFRDLLLPFYWVGGAGANDGLFLFPLGVALLASVAPIIFKRPALVGVTDRSSP